MKYIYIILLISLIIVKTYSQDAKRDNTWVFCDNANGGTVMDFDAGYPVCDSLSTSFYIDLSNASVSDTNGKLLFYTNGYKIMNKNHLLMANGDSLNCCMGAFNNGMIDGYGNVQGTIILTHPGNPCKYVIFHTPLDFMTGPPYYGFTPLLYYSVVDMSHNNGLGEVIEKNKIALNDTISLGLVTACRHANGRDWWLIIREYFSNRFHRLLLSPTGIQDLGTQTIGNQVEDNIGQSVFSPDGSKFVIATIALPNLKYFYHIYDFDRCTGLLSNPLQDTIYEPSGWVGCGISPNSKYVYFASSTKIYQYDLQSTDMGATQQLVATWDSTFQDSLGFGYAFGWMTPGPDNKIYIYGGGGGSRYLNVIHQPDSQGLACDITHHSLMLKSLNSRSMPNFPNFRLGALSGSGCDTLQQVGVPAASETEPIKIYPNPTQDKLHIANAPPHCVAVMYDLLGRERLRVAVANNEIEVGSLAEGVYVLRLESAGKTVALQKIVLQR